MAQNCKPFRSIAIGYGSVSFSPDGQMIASASHDCTVMLIRWNLGLEDLLVRGCNGCEII
jgi:WD40 repeat protein